MSVNYEVVLSLKTEGELGAKLGDVEAKAGRAHLGMERLRDGASRAGDSVGRMGERLASVLDSAYSRVEGLASGFGKVAAAMGVGAVAYGVTHLNSELEQTQISLAAIATGQGFTSTFADGMKLAADQISKMKTEVASLPVTMTQFAGVMQSLAIPGASAGATMGDIRKLAADTARFSPIAQVGSDQAGREVAELLEGRMRASNKVGQLLGFGGEKEKAFNAEGGSARLKDVQAAFGKYAGANDASAQTFKALTTTVVDDAKNKFLQPITSSLFTHVKDDLVKVHEWVGKNDAKISHFTDVVGGKLAHAWDRVANVVERLTPTFGRIAGYIEGLDGEKLKHLGMNAGAAMLVGRFAPAAVGGAASLLGEGIGGIGAAAAGGGAAAGLGLASTGFALAGLTVATVGAIGAIDNLRDAHSAFHSQTVEHMKGLGSSAEHAWASARLLVADLKPGVDAIGNLFVGMLDNVASTAATAAGQVHEHGDLIKTGLMAIVDALPGLGMAAHTLALALKGYESYAGMGTGNATGGHYQRFTSSPGGWSTVTPTTTWDALKSHAQNVSQTFKVEIVVKGSDDPSRVARLTKEHLDKIARHPTSSKYVTDYSKPET